MRKSWVKRHERQLWERPNLGRRRPRRVSVGLKAWAAAGGAGLVEKEALAKVQKKSVGCVRSDA